MPLDKEGNSVTEKTIKKSEMTWQYLINHKRELAARAVVKKGYVHEWFGVLVPKAARSSGKVVYRLISPQLEASVLPGTIRLGERKTLLLPDQSIRFIEVDDLDGAAYLAGIMNSSLLRCIAYLCVSPKGGVPYRQFMAWNVGFIPMIRFAPENRLCSAIAKLALRLADEPSEAEKYQDELDKKVAELYGVSSVEIDILKEHSAMMHGTPLPNS
jgi:hypothetical protein